MIKFDLMLTPYIAADNAKSYSKNGVYAFPYAQIYFVPTLNIL